MQKEEAELGVQNDNDVKVELELTEKEDVSVDEVNNEIEEEKRLTECWKVEKNSEINAADSKEDDDGPEAREEEKRTEGESGIANEEGEEAEDEEEKSIIKGNNKETRTPKNSKKNDFYEESKGNNRSVNKEVEHVTPASDRPARERKIVERYSAPDALRSSATKPLSIEKGSGTQLKDIPNVAFRLSKKKVDDDLKMFHTILFGKKGKTNMLKKNIGQFSGFVWAEEKQKVKIREKLDKCNKERLISFCDLLNIPRSKASDRKEELTTKVLEFLESPHSTTDVLLAEKEKKSKKRKHSVSKQINTGEKSSTLKRKSSKTGDKQSPDVKKHDEEDDTDGEINAQSPVAGNDSEGEENSNEFSNPSSDHLEENSEEDEDDNKENASVSSKRVKENRKKPDSGKKTASTKSQSKSVELSSKRRATEVHETDTKKKNSARKKQKVDEHDKNRNFSSKEKNSRKGKHASKITEKRKGKATAGKKAEPTRDEMNAVIVDILKEVDFNTATLNDILNQLSKHFGVELMHKRTEVKEIITEVINSMSSDDDSDDDV